MGFRPGVPGQWHVPVHASPAPTTELKALVKVKDDLLRKRQMSLLQDVADGLRRDCTIKLMPIPHYIYLCTVIRTDVQKLTREAQHNLNLVLLLYVPLFNFFYPYTLMSSIAVM